LHSYLDRLSDDFRTALQNAQSLITALSSITRPIIQDPSAPTSSSGISVLPESAEIDAKLVDVLSKLVVAMQRNLRVRYELKIPDLIKT
jgi:rapamycin-insensitive companion of mTOR